MMNKGFAPGLNRQGLDGIHASSSGIAALRQLEQHCLPYYSSCLAIITRRLVSLRMRGASSRSLGTIEETNERWFEAEIYRMRVNRAQIPELGWSKSRVYFHALSQLRERQAKSFELRAAMSMARLWSEQAKRAEARNLWLQHTAGSRKVLTPLI